MGETGRKVDPETDRLSQEIEGDPDPLWERANRRYADGDAEGARADMKQVVSLSPDTAIAWAELAKLEACAGNPDEAIACCARAIRLKPASYIAYKAGLVQELLSRWEQASAHFSLAIPQFKSGRPDYVLLPFAYSHRGWARWKLGQLDAAQEDIVKALEIDKNCAHAHLFKALMTRNAPEARESMDHAVSLASEDAFVRVSHGLFYRDIINNEKGADEEIKAAKKLDPILTDYLTKKRS